MGHSILSVNVVIVVCFVGTHAFETTPLVSSRLSFVHSFREPPSLPFSRIFFCLNNVCAHVVASTMHTGGGSRAPSQKATEEQQRHVKTYGYA